VRTTIRFMDYASYSEVATVTVSEGYAHVPRVGDHWQCRDVLTKVITVITEYGDDGNVEHRVLVGRVRETYERDAEVEGER